MMTINIHKILLIDEFLLSCKIIEKEKWRYFFLFFQLIVFADMWKYCRSDELLVFNCFCSGALALQYKIEWRKIFTIMLLYAGMTLAPINNYGLDVRILNQYIGYAIRVLTACFIASYFKYDLIIKFENLVFVLAYISIPFYMLQIINPHIYDIFTPISKFIMEGRQNYMTPWGITMHQYILFFVLNGWAHLRNSGFMWEPAAYGMMLTWAMLVCMYTKKFRWHSRMIIYAIAILTTFSLGTYSYALILVLMFLMQNSDWKKIVYVLIAAVGIVVIYTQTNLLDENVDMMTNKAENYAENSEKLLEQKNDIYIMESKSPKQVNRLSQLFIFREILHEAPLGRGMSQWKYSSANGLVSLAVMWGYPFLVILIMSCYFFSKNISRITQTRPHFYTILMSMLLMMLPLIGNPIYNQVFWLTILVYPFFAKQYTYYNLYER